MELPLLAESLWAFIKGIWPFMGPILSGIIVALLLRVRLPSKCRIYYKRVEYFPESPKRQVDWFFAIEGVKRTVEYLRVTVKVGDRRDYFVSYLFTDGDTENFAVYDKFNRVLPIGNIQNPAGLRLVVRNVIKGEKIKCRFRMNEKGPREDILFPEVSYKNRTRVKYKVVRSASETKEKGD